MFLNDEGREYLEFSGVSGLNDPADARSFATLDFDGDGWTDLAVVNANAPLLQLFRNRIGDAGESSNGMIALRFVGGNREAAPSERWSARDGFGARVTLEINGRRIVREHIAGAGFAAQNSATMRIGIGPADAVTRLVVRWPSGVVRSLSDVPRGALVVAHEDPDAAPGGEAFAVTLPERSSTFQGGDRPSRQAREAAGSVLALPGLEPGRLTLYTTMATWCAPCLEELPTLAHLRRSLGEANLRIFGIPHDEDETSAELEAWAREHSPTYELLTDLSLDQRAAVSRVTLEALRGEGLPVSIVTDGAGRVLLVRWGPPTVSQLRLLLERTGNTH
ncbi:MAG: hypothetical protein CMJ84_10215 [Planctomycetes bacterium]|nr:hypothetical protein [Planctomycetota bacterium]MDP6408779.1 ASPIC/UnbV domain-containing protein [Planctomycetota bacterium]